MRIVLALFVALALAACGDNSFCTSDCMTVDNGGTMIRGSGNTKTQTLAVGKFSALRLVVPGNAVIEGGAGTTSVTVTADENLLPLLVADVKDGTLILSLAQGKSYEGKIPEYRISVGDLRALDVTGSGTIKASKLAGPVLAIVASGSGTVDAAGQVDDLTMSLKGSGTVDAAKLKAKRGKVVVSGSAEATVNVSDELDATISGSGTVRYIGSPKITKNITGSGEIRQKSP